MSQATRGVLALVMACQILACHDGSPTSPAPIGPGGDYADDNPLAQPDLVQERIDTAALMQGVTIPGTHAVVALMEVSHGICAVARIDLDTRVRTPLADGASCDQWRQGLAISPDGTVLYYLVAGDSTTWDGPMTVRQLTLATGDAVDLVTDSSEAGPLALSPDGKWLVYSFVEYGPGFSLDLYLRDLTTGSDVLLARTKAPMEGSLAFSPDGAQLVFADSGGWLARTLTIGTGSSEILPDPVSGSPQFSWTSAGLQYVAVIPCSTVCQVLTNVTTGDRLGMYVDESLLAWSTDGRHVAGTTAWCADWACSTRRIEVVVGDWETHQQTVIGRQTDCGLRGPYGMVVSPDGNRVVYGLCSGTYVWSRP